MNFALARHRMVTDQLERRGITDFRVLEAMDTVPREEFVPASLLDKAYDDWFSTKGEILYLSNIALSQEVFPRTFAKVDYISPSAEFSIRELIDPSEHSRTYAGKYRGPHRQIRFIPKEFLPLQGDIGVFGKTVLITSVKKEYFTVKIESEEIAHVFRMLYEALWRMSAE